MPNSLFAMGASLTELNMATLLMSNAAITSLTVSVIADAPTEQGKRRVGSISFDRTASTRG
jgi:hypothetical protein